MFIVSLVQLIKGCESLLILFQALFYVGYGFFYMRKNPPTLQYALSFIVFNCLRGTFTRLISTMLTESSAFAHDQ